MKILSSKEYKEIINNKSGKVVIDFFATWCMPCQMLSPIIEEVSKEYSDVEMYKVNVDDAQEVAIENNILSIPTVCFIKDGQEVNRIVGLVSKEELKEVMEKM